MTTRSKQLFAGRVTAAEVDLYTCPADRVTIVRSVECLNMSGNSRTAGFGVKLSGEDPILLAPIALMATFGSISSDRWRVLKEGDILYLVSLEAGAVDLSVLVSGAELMFPAP